MFYFRINKLKIIDNMERPRYLWLFGPDVAQVKLVSFVTTDKMHLPDMTDFIHTNKWSEKKKILNTAVEQIVNSRILTTIENVKDNHVMYFGDTGYVLYKSKQIPEHLDWQFIAYESKQNIRDTAAMAKDIVNDKGFDEFSHNLLLMLQSTENPAYVASVSIAKYAIQTINKLVQNSKDDMLGIIYMSLNRREHYPHGERKRDDVPDLTNNMFFDYSIFGYEE